MLLKFVNSASMYHVILLLQMYEANFIFPCNMFQYTPIFNSLLKVRYCCFSIFILRIVEALQRIVYITHSFMMKNLVISYFAMAHTS